MKKFLVIVCVVASALLEVSVSVCRADYPPDNLIDAQIQVESGGNDSKVGDLKLANHAYGCLQIRQPVCDDYNRWNGTHYKAQDCLGHRDLSIKICKDYVDHYATQRWLHHVPTLEDQARIWNGGPNGWKKTDTVDYWNQVQSVLED